MYIDLNIKYSNRLDEVIDLAIKLGYKALAVEGINKPFEGELKIFPRVTYPYTGKSIKLQRTNAFIKVLEVGEPSMIKALDRLRGKCHMIQLSSKALAGLRGRHIKLLKNSGIPIEIPLTNLIKDNCIHHTYIRGISRLAPYVERGVIELIISSGASTPLELAHPLHIVALLNELGLSYLTSLKAITTSPLRILRSVSDGY